MSHLPLLPNYFYLFNLYTYIRVYNILYSTEYYRRCTVCLVHLWAPITSNPVCFYLESLCREKALKSLLQRNVSCFLLLFILRFLLYRKIYF